MDISPDATRLLEIMRSGREVIYRSVIGRATHYSSAVGEQDCTRELLELFKAKLVKAGRIDKGSGWVWYIPVDDTKKGG